MVGRENIGLFCHSLYGDLYGDARFGAVRWIRLRRWVLRGGCACRTPNRHRLRRGGQARRYSSRLIMTSLRQSGALTVKLNVTASPDAPAGVV